MQETKTTQEKHKCPGCGQSFDSREELRRHEEQCKAVLASAPK